MGRAPCCDKANVKRGPWSPEEDAKLKSHIEKQGTGGNWIALPQKIGLKRCGKSCRLRWLNYLRPNIKHGGFTEDEDNLICSLYISIGSRWSIIAAQLPGRTDNDIKNYWNTRLKKKLAGRQRRQQSLQTKRQITNQKNYSIFNECLSLYNQLQPPPPPPNSAANISMMMPALEAQFPCNRLQTTNNIELNPTTTTTTSDQFQYNCDDLIHVQDQHYHCSNSLMVPSSSTGFGGDFRALDEVHEGSSYHMPQEMDGLLDNFFDISCLVQPPAVSNTIHEVWQRKTQQNWAFFDHPRLLG